jgi:membrane-bound lytic murein transglycosylase D
MKNPGALNSLSPSSKFFNSSPAGERWSNRSQIPIPNQPAIQRQIRFYEGKGRSDFSGALERSWSYSTVMAQILDSEGVPPELIAVVMVESCFKGRASHKGAVGYWQLLASTARSMGLRVDRWVDERYDPVKSTQAAAKYLRSLYDQFGCWTLAIAAYNSGDAPVMSAIKKHGVNDFWEISKRGSLPRITRAYVPKVLAAIRIMRNLDAHGFESPQQFPIYDYESVSIKSPLQLEQVAKWINVPTSDLRDLNPSLRHDRLPPNGGVKLNLPSGARDKFDVAYARYTSGRN